MRFKPRRATIFLLKKRVKKLLQSKNSGFTLIELLVVISVITILSIIGIATFVGFSRKADDSKLRSDISAIARAYETNFNNVSGQYSSLQSDWFSTGKIPTRLDGSDYFSDLGQGGTGFRVCSPLDSAPTCNTSSDTCLCIESAQGPYIPSASPEPSPSIDPSPGPSLTPSPEPTVDPTPPPDPPPTCSFDGPLALTAGAQGHYIVATTGTVDTYFWQTISPTVSGIYSPSNIVSDIDWSSDTADSYTLQLTVSGPGGVGACQNLSPIVVSSVPTPTPTPVNQPPNCSSINGTASIEVNQSTSFTATVSDPDGTITGYSWTASAGSPTFGNSATFNWGAPIQTGSINIDLTVIDDGGLQASCPTSVVNVVVPTSYKRVFAVGVFTGSLASGVTGANSKCQTAATSAALGGTWKAWLSDGTTSASSNISTHSSSTYKLVNGLTTVANNWADLIDGTLQNSINMNASGSSVGTVNVWTNTTIAGASIISGSTTANCSAFSSSAGSRSARVGSSDSTTNTWTNTGGTNTCSTSNYLYCFEQ